MDIWSSRRRWFVFAVLVLETFILLLRAFCFIVLTGLTELMYFFFFFKEYFIIAVFFILLERKISQCEFFPASCRATSSNCFQLSPPRETSESTDKLRILSCEEDRCLVSVIETDGCIQPAKMGHKCTLITLLKGSQCKNVQEPSLRTTYTVLSGINASVLCRLF